MARLLKDPKISDEKKKEMSISIMRSLTDSKATRNLARCTVENCNSEIFELCTFLAAHIGLPKPRSPMQYSDYLAFNKAAMEKIIKMMGR